MPLKITDVFTPRNPNVNLRTYVPRLGLETALIRSIQGSMHSVLFGESGNGKSWLYMKVLRQHGYFYKVANCANASRFGSITSEIVNTIHPPGDASKTGYTETKEASLKALVADGKLAHQGQFTIRQEEPLLAAFKKFRSMIGRGDAVIVLDNLESIFGNESLMNELADIIILLDDARYAETKIKLLIVGVPNGILEYFATTKNLESVANRLEELPKVGGMTLAMSKTIVETGFNDLLGLALSPEDIEMISKHIHHCTLGVAQRIQEYCERLAYKIEDNRKFSQELLQQANIEWLRLGLRQAYTVIESHLNAKRTTIARRNQVVYCIGKIPSHQLDTLKVAEKIREIFPDKANDTNMGIGSILGELASTDTPLLKRNPNTSEYRIADPRYLMCIRLMLTKAPDGTIYKHSFSY